MIQTNCPLCQTSFKLPDTQLGKRVRCKSCAGTFLVQDEPAAPVLEEASEEDLQQAVRRPTALVEELPVLEDVPDEPKRSAVRPAPPPPAPSRHRPDEDPRPIRRDRDDDYRDRPSRRPRDDDYRNDPRSRDRDRDRDRGSGGGSMLLIGACVALLLVLGVGGGLAFYFASSSPDTKDPQTSNTNPTGQGGNPDPFGGNQGGANPAGGNPAGGGNPPDPPPPPPPPPPTIPDPKDVDAALAMLQDARVDARRVALKWLERVPAADRALNRTAVGKAIKPLLTDRELAKDAFNTAVEWRCPECIPQLAAKLTDNFNWQSALKPLSEMQDDEATELLAKQLGVSGRSFWVREPLKQVGKRAEKFVLKYLHDPDSGVRRDAKDILDHYGTSSTLILEQTITDLESAEKATRLAALDTIGTLRVPKEQQAKVAKALEGFMSDTNVFHRRKAMKVLNELATEDTLATIHNTLTDPDAAVRETALLIIARIKSEQSIEPVSHRLFAPAKEQAAAVQLLLSYGSKAEKAVQVQLTHANSKTRGLACALLAEIGTKDSLEVLRKFGLADKLNVKIAIAARQKIMAREKEKAKLDKDKGKE